jgi:hypothetical protein
VSRFAPTVAAVGNGDMGRVGFDTAERYLGYDGDPTTVYERSTDVSIAGLYPAMPDQKVAVGRAR